MTAGVGGRPSPSMDVFDVGQCEGGYKMGYLVGERFAGMIQSRVAADVVVTEQLLPFSETPVGRRLLAALEDVNRRRYPLYWDEMTGLADGSGVPLLKIMLLNFRKEMLPFVGSEEDVVVDDDDGDCSDVLLVSDSTAFVAHNEDASAALLGRTFFLRAELPGGTPAFTAYTCAGELPSCAFGFNGNGLAFTLNSVPPLRGEIVAGGVSRNFVSRDLLEAKNIDDAIARIRAAEVSVGHSYNLVDVKTRRIMNVETASANRCSVLDAGGGNSPFFHANMYRHLAVPQTQDESSMRRERRAAMLPLSSPADALAALGDAEDELFPIFMEGPKLHTLCTVLIDADKATMTIYRGNPKHLDAMAVLDIIK